MTYTVNDNGTDREATADEIKQIEKDQKQAAKQDAARVAALEAAAAAKDSARAKLKALGLTDDEIAALGA